MIYYEGFGVTVHHGDCVDVMQELPDASVDAVVTDPPYGISFMEDWDSFGSKQAKAEASREFQKWCDIWTAECLRVLKPGGHLLAFGGTRMWHRLACAVEDAGFEIRDSIAWLQGQGFPKSFNVAKAIDKMSGVEPTVEREIADHLRERREELGLTKAEVDQSVFGGTSRYSWVEGRDGKIYLPTPEEWVVLKEALSLDDRYDSYIAAAIPPRSDRHKADGGKAVLVATTDRSLGYAPGGERRGGQHRSTAPATDEAAQWQGWGTALRPCHEPIVVARKPLEGSVAANVLAHGTGALNIDATRIGAEEITSNHTALTSAGEKPRPWGTVQSTHIGRWPPNVVVAHLPECEPGEIVTESVIQGGASRSSSRSGGVGRGVSVQTWNCAPDCQVAALDAQSGITKDGVAVRQNGISGGSTISFGARAEGSPNLGYGGEGGASRFFLTVEQTLNDLPIRAFYTAKANGAERPVVGDAQHVTVKPVSLMRWLVRMVCPPGGTVLDPFGGSGTTAEACVIEGFRCVTIEREAEYLPLIVSRVVRQRDPVAHTRLTKTESDEPTLFDDL